MGQFSMEILRQTGSVLSGTQQTLYEAVKMQLRSSGAIFLHLDEAQHLMKNYTTAAVRGLQDRFKSLLVIPDWPLHLILSGVPELAALFDGDQQLANRSVQMRFGDLVMPGDKPLIEKILSDIVVVNCGLKLPKSLLTDDFLGRLVRATGGGVGTMIEMVRAASYKALSKGHEDLSSKDFEFVYARVSGSLDCDNIFTAKNWTDLDRSKALSDLVPTPAKSKRNGKAAK